MKGKLIKLQEEIDTATTMVRDFNGTLLTLKEKEQLK